MEMGMGLGMEMKMEVEMMEMETEMVRENQISLKGRAQILKGFEGYINRFRLHL